MSNIAYLGRVLIEFRDGRTRKAAMLHGIAIALLGSASALSAVPSAQAGPADPASCANFMQNKFSSGKPAGSRANFSLVTENQSQGATYAEGDLAYVKTSSAMACQARGRNTSATSAIIRAAAAAVFAPPPTHST